MDQFGKLAYHTVVGVCILLVFVLLIRVVRWVLNLVGRRIISKTETTLDDRLLVVVLKSVGPVMIVTGLWVALREIAKGVAPDDQTALELIEYGRDILYIAAAIVALRVAVGAVSEFLGWYLERISGDGSDNLRRALGPLTTKTVNFALSLVAVIIVLDHFGINIGSLLVSLGVGSLAVALAAQETIANMIAGFVILVDRPFRIGDRIEVGSGVVGDILTIGLRSTRLLNFDNNVMIIPNSDMIKSRITNYAYPYNQMRVMLQFDLAYGADVARAREILLGLVQAHPDVLADPAPTVTVTTVSANAVTIVVVARCRDFSVQYATETVLREQAYRALLQHGIPVPIEKRLVRLDPSPSTPTPATS
ncbi:MAG TPA: mechanosensitive ion channel family protein [Bacteroidota bacterium]|nr:mechanosensitive ion channel family protein [Bacteroidota bacterium]